MKMGCEVSAVIGTGALAMRHGVERPRTPASHRSRASVLGAARVLFRTVVLAAVCWCCVGVLGRASQAFCGPALGRTTTTTAPALQRRPLRRGLAARHASAAPEVLEKDATKEAEKKAAAILQETLDDASTPEEREERIMALGIALLQSTRRAEKLFEKEMFDLGGDGKLNSAEFKLLLDELDLVASQKDSDTVFATLGAVDGDGIAPEEFRERVRNSSIITDMYQSSFKNVGTTVVFSFGVAFLIFLFKGTESGVDFLTAYFVEDSLSVDNLFVFLALFKYFKVPPALQSYCLNVGIYGAVVLRALFIFAGLAAVQAFKPLLLAFAAFLIFASFKTLSANDDDEDEDEEEDGAPAGPIMSLLGKLPTTPSFDGDKLFAQNVTKPGEWSATPLLLCIIAVELSDILFAVDSIPAVFAVTSDPLVVYTSNIAAILGLRSLYQVLAVAAEDLIYLEKAVAILLGFIGLKLTAEVAGFELNSLISLFAIVGILGGGIYLSLEEQKKMKAAAEEAKAVRASSRGEVA